MNLKLRKRALNTLADIVDWIEEQNTPGAGDRWLVKTFAELNSVAASHVNHAICKEPKLARFKYRCFTYKDKWVVAYKIESNRFVVYRFVYGPWLDY
jgi:hypothetical protein